jgi:hypothetical protein
MNDPVTVLVPLDLLKLIRQALMECSEDLMSELDDRYRGTLDYPTQARRYNNDKKPVVDARYCLDQLAELPGLAP